MDQVNHTQKIGHSPSCQPIVHPWLFGEISNWCQLTAPPAVGKAVIHANRSIRKNGLEPSGSSAKVAVKVNPPWPTGDGPYCAMAYSESTAA